MNEVASKKYGQIAPGIWRGRWGYYPCSYNTFVLLKRLCFWCLKAATAQARYDRWNNKLPKNRVLRRNIRNDGGQKIGSEIIGPMPRPKLCDVFTLRATQKSLRDLKFYCKPSPTPQSCGLMGDAQRLRIWDLAAKFRDRDPKIDKAMQDELDAAGI